MKITTDHILDALIKERDLTYGGFTASASEIKAWQPRLIKAVAEVQLCADWIAQQEIGKRVTSYGHSSYYLKHAVEFSLKYSKGFSDPYVSNGAFLCAVIILDVPYKRHPIRYSPNATVAIRDHRRNRKLYRSDASWALGYTNFKPMKVAE